MSEELEISDGFSVIEKSSGGFKITGNYPFYSEIKSEDDSFEVQLQDTSAPPYTNVNIYLKAADSVSSILNFTLGPKDSGRQTLELVENNDGLLILNPSSNSDHPESSLGLQAGGSGTTVLVTDGNGNVYFLAAPEGKHVLGVSKHEYGTGQAFAAWCWYGIVTHDDMCAGTE